MVKGLYYDARIVRNTDEGAEAFRKISAEWGVPVPVQRVVQGDEISLAAMVDGAGNMPGRRDDEKIGRDGKCKAWADVSSEAAMRYPADATMQVYLARAYARLKKDTQARVIYEPVLERIPRHLEAVQYLQKGGR